MPPGLPPENRSWVVPLIEQRLDAIEEVLSAFAAWVASPTRDTDLLMDPRLVDQALDVGWRELIDLIPGAKVDGDTLEDLAEVCEQAVDLFDSRELPRPYENILEALLSSMLELEEGVFIPHDYDPEADDDDPRSSYRIPWWMTW